MELRPILSTLIRSKTGHLLVALQVAISLAILANALHIVNLRQAVAVRPSGLSDESAVFYLRVRHLDTASHAEQLARQKVEIAALGLWPACTRQRMSIKCRYRSRAGAPACPRASTPTMQPVLPTISARSQWCVPGA